MCIKQRVKKHEKEQINFYKAFSLNKLCAMEVADMSEYDCFHFFVGIRWPDGVCCPRCQNNHLSFRDNRKQWRCLNKECRYEFSVKSGTILHSLKLNYKKILFGIALIAAEKDCGSSCMLARNMGINEDTALDFRHRINDAFLNDVFDITPDGLVAKNKLTGNCQMDATGIHPHFRRPNLHYIEKTDEYKANKKANRAKNSHCLIAIHSEELKRTMTLVVDAENQQTATQMALNCVEKGSHIFTDCHAAYNLLSENGFEHTKVNHQFCFKDTKGNHTNYVESTFARIKGFRRSMLHFSKQHIQGYACYFDFHSSHCKATVGEKMQEISRVLFAKREPDSQKCQQQKQQMQMPAPKAKILVFVNKVELEQAA